MDEFLASFSKIPFYTWIIFFGGIISIIILLPNQIIKLVKKTHPSEIGNIKFENEQDSLMNNPEARDYRQNIIIGFDEIKSNLRYRIRSNGWEKITDWDQYVNCAIVNFDTIMCDYMDVHYYTNSLIDRLTLSDQNKIIWEDVKKKYIEMFNNILTIIKEEKNNVKKCEENLEECKKKPKNILISDLIHLITKIKDRKSVV